MDERDDKDCNCGEQVGPASCSGGAYQPTFDLFGDNCQDSECAYTAFWIKASVPSIHKASRKSGISEERDETRASFAGKPCTVSMVDRRDDSVNWLPLVTQASSSGFAGEHEIAMPEGC